MKRIAFTLTLLSVMALVVGIAGATEPDPESMSFAYGDVTITATNRTSAGHFDEIWDLTACDLTVSFTVDMTGFDDDYCPAGHADGELGIRSSSYAADFNPNAAGAWMNADFDCLLPDTFDPDPGGVPVSDLDGKFVL